MKLSLFLVCLIAVGCTSCKTEDPAYSALPGRRMTEFQALSAAQIIFPPSAEQATYRVSFGDGLWKVSCESNHVSRAVIVRDADGMIVQTNLP